ncbi:uncharacterized protein LOC115879422 [Sitophilus oryzae]|uniref:Uncharacterized protein LOC115879422 n=1 Tax=Sitophilus oryzae TaxID=7048 RepID=A0A6J2XKS4_SITOR|nr:uncharacterized protein LOC115879422 [Sitophilus oryzae]XP_030752112.1 uncharacterized protein LOC115879422 [Sitophilus oryzae]XP_030752113.1 uncharacterized protein LOC115879422 [Sitophilus oryzae]
MSSEVKKIEEKLEKPTEKTEKENVLDNKTKEENEKEVDEVKEPPKKSLVKRIKEEWQLIAKILELVLCALCLGFFYQPAAKSANFAKHHLEQVGLIFLTFIGYLLINAVFIVSKLIKDRIPFRTSATFSLLAAILNFIAGIVLIVDRRNKFQGIYYEPQMYLLGMLTGSTILCFVNSAVYGLDGVYTFLLKKDY